MDGIANFFSVVPNPMVLVNTQGIVVLANERVCNLFGYEEGALAGKALSDLIPERFRESHMKLLAKYFQEPHVREMGIGMELTGLQRAALFWMRAQVSHGFVSALSPWVVSIASQ